VLVAHDLFEQSSTDTVLIHVLDPALPVSPTTWGSIKALFGNQGNIGSARRETAAEGTAPGPLG
jgi:hypothetical protein